MIFMTIALGSASAPATAENIEYIECPSDPTYVYDLTLKDEPLVQTGYENPNICAEVDGYTYTIELQDWDYPKAYIEEVFDADDDGTDEALVVLHTGGNACCMEYVLVNYAGEGFFRAITHPSFKNADAVLIKKKDNNFLIQSFFTHLSKEILAEFVFKHGELVLLSEHYNRAKILTSFYISSEEVDSSPSNRTSFVVLADKDEETDDLVCHVWGRDRLLGCALSSSSGLRARLPNCRGLGFATNYTNGLANVVCDNVRVYTFNGIDEYIFAKNVRYRSEANKLRFSK